MSIGIDGIEVRTGKLKLDLPNTFAPQKDDDPGKYTEGLGLYASSFPDAHEDIVTMGANAAHRLMDRKGIVPDDVGRIDVATESAFDHSKPVSTYVAGCLEKVFEGDFHHANKGERKFACVSGTQAIDDAYNWIAAGRNRGRAAIVIATDTALYERGDPGEATQGAGAVAMLVSEDPGVVELHDEQGYGSADETDFLKPNQHFPSVDGKRSIQVYLARMREAMKDFESVAGRIHPGDYRFAPFHTPFPGMVRKAALLGYRHAVRNTEVEDEIAEEIGRRQPREDEYDDRESYEEALQAYMDDLQGTEHYGRWYDRTVDPTLGISREVGNWYTGSVHIARASALQWAHDNDVDVASDRMLVASYGSGAQAEIHAETIRPGFEEEVAAWNVYDQIENRYDLDWEEYEEIHDTHNYDKELQIEDFTTPESEFVFTGWGRMGERQYEYVE